MRRTGQGVASALGTRLWLVGWLAGWPGRIGKLHDTLPLI